MALESESESPKKSFYDMGDVYGLVIAPQSQPQPPSPNKELDHLNHNRHLHLRLQLPDVNRAMKDILRTREVGEFLSGALAGAMTKAVLAPLETIRWRHWQVGSYFAACAKFYKLPQDQLDCLLSYLSPIFSAAVSIYLNLQICSTKNYSAVAVLVGIVVTLITPLFCRYL